MFTLAVWHYLCHVEIVKCSHSVTVRKKKRNGCSFPSVWHLPFIHSSDMLWKFSAVVQSCSYGCLSDIKVWSIGNWLWSFSSKVCSLLICCRNDSGATFRMISMIYIGYQSFQIRRMSTGVFVVSSTCCESAVFLASSSVSADSRLAVIWLRFPTLFFISSMFITSFFLKACISLSTSCSLWSKSKILR